MAMARLNYATTNSWGSGFLGNVTLDAEQAALDGWTVSFAAPFEITSIWGAEIVGRANGIHTVRSLDWNAQVGAGGSVGFGFVASGAGDPTGLRLGEPASAPPPPAPPLPAPVASIADAQLVEGDQGSAEMAFTVSLSAAAAAPVSLAWTTADGTARAGQDYVAAAGTVGFAAGETSKTIRVAVQGDRLQEASESLSVALSAPVGATLGRAQATGTILDDDAAPVTLPTLTVADAAVAEGNGGGGAPGYLSTSGNQIVDAAGQPVRLAAVSWFGMESETLAPHGLWTRNWQEMMGEIKAQGFNAIRLPFATDALHATAIGGVDFGLNPDLRGLTPLQLMDRVVAEAGQLGLRIILDHHTIGAARQVGENGYWYDATHSETDWVNDWVMLAARYAGNPTVIGADLHNEPWAATWSEWDRAAERAGNAIHAVNPDLLIIVEGVSVANGDSYWWGGNLQGARDNPVVLNQPNKVVYSPHDYPNGVYPQSWFQPADFGDMLYRKFDQNWGYLFRENLAPIWVGEFGTELRDPKDRVWLDKITAYLQGDFDTNGTVDLAPGQLGQSWSWWSWNPNSFGTGGILQDDWRTVIGAKVDALKPLMFSFPDAGGPESPNMLSFAATLSEAAAGLVSLDWRTAPGTAGTADFTAAAGRLTFAAGERTKLVQVAVTGDRAVEADETVILELLNVAGATPLHASATGTIRNDDGVAGPPPTAGGLAGSIRVTQDWGTGYLAEVTLRNDGPALNGWNFGLRMADSVVNLWDGSITGQSDGTYQVANAAWNGGLATGASVTVGFQAHGHHLPGQADLIFG